MNQKQTKTYLYCFTPLVSLATFSLEILLALYAFYKYRKTTFGKISFLIIVCLASFQLPEYLLCRNMTTINATLIQIAFIGTIFLPALGLHLVTVLNNRRSYRWLVGTGYLLAIGVSVLILASSGSAFMHACTGQYVRFHLDKLVTLTYFFTYLILIATSLVLLLFHIKMKQHTRVNTYILGAMLSFLLPTYTLYFLSFIPNEGIPSVLCGFALIAALILVGKILPLYHTRTQEDGLINKNNYE